MNTRPHTALSTALASATFGAAIILAASLSASPPAVPQAVQGQSSGQPLSEKDQWAADLDLLAKELPARHKNLFFKIKPEEFRAAAASLRAQIPNLTKPRFLMGLSRLVASVGDSHTSFTIMPQSAFPLKLYWFKEGICVIDTTPEHSGLLNGRLTAIDGHPIEEAVRAFAGIFPHDNEAQVKDFVPRFLGSTEHLLGLGLIAESAEATFSVETADGRTISAKMKSLPLADVRKVSWAARQPDRSELPFYRRMANSAYDYFYMPRARTLYFAYNSCRDLPDRPFVKFAEELWAVTRNNPVDRIIVDLRINGGGDSSILDSFINELAANADLNRKGRLFVILGRRTFSSAILNALDLKKKTKAIFFGEPTGGRPNHYGEIQTLTLPNLKLDVSYSTKYFKFVDGDDPSLVPDVLVEFSLADYLALNDPVLDAILAQTPNGAHVGKSAF
jgi:hypothetical protein